MRDLTRHYDTLTAEERFQLFVEAASRKDYHELDRLNDSCPRKTYRLEDWDYTRRKLRLFDMALLHANEVANTDCLAFAALSLLLANEDDPRSEESFAKLQDTLVKLAVKRRSMEEAWNRFCCDVGISPERAAPILDVFGGERDWLFQVVDRTVTDAIGIVVEPEESQVTAWHSQWSECWNGGK